MLIDLGILKRGSKTRYLMDVPARATNSKSREPPPPPVTIRQEASIHEDDACVNEWEERRRRGSEICSILVRWGFFYIQ